MSNLPLSMPGFVTRLRAHIHFPRTEGLEDQINTILKSIGKKALSKQEQTLNWMIRHEGSLWRCSLDMQAGEGEGEDEDVDQSILVFTFTIRRTSRASSALLGQRRLEQASLVLAAIKREPSDCSVFGSLSWHYPLSKVQLPIRLPFGIPVASTSSLQSVSGIRISNDEDDTWVIFDAITENDTLHVSSGFAYETLSSDALLTSVAEFGQNLLVEVGFRYEEEI